MREHSICRVWKGDYLACILLLPQMRHSFHHEPWIMNLGATTLPVVAQYPLPFIALMLALSYTCFLPPAYLTETTITMTVEMSGTKYPWEASTKSIASPITGWQLRSTLESCSAAVHS